jgi:hypothetical protein
VTVVTDIAGADIPGADVVAVATSVAEPADTSMYISSRLSSTSESSSLQTTSHQQIMPEGNNTH